MIVDMVRNDLGRVARTSAPCKVPELFTTEKYDTVWQMTSTVTAEPRPGISLPEVFGALFPCASITGAPKVATMRLIAELESTPPGRLLRCGRLRRAASGRSGMGLQRGHPHRHARSHPRRRRVRHGRWGDLRLDCGRGVPGSAAESARPRAAHHRILAARDDAMDPGTGLPRPHRPPGTTHAFGVVLRRPGRPGRGPKRARRRRPRGDPPRRVRLLVARDGTISTETTALPTQAGPVTMVLDTERIDPRDAMLRHKTTERTVYEDAARRHAGFDDVVLVTADELVADTTIATFCAEIDGTWFTPRSQTGPCREWPAAGWSKRAACRNGRSRSRNCGGRPGWRGSTACEAGKRRRSRPPSSPIRRSAPAAAPLNAGAGRERPGSQPLLDLVAFRSPTRDACVDRRPDGGDVIGVDPQHVPTIRAPDRTASSTKSAIPSGPIG
jgi:para-aminobenzoate synthetase / 4-amino-4-deoxychorismate lyase